MKAQVINLPYPEAQVIEMDPTKTMSSKFLFKKYMDLSTPEEFRQAYKKELELRGHKIN